jgi:hypothetical protein
MFANALSNCQESTEITGACSLARHIQKRSQRALGVCQEICMISVDIKVAASDRRYAVLFESLFQLEDTSYWTERQYFCLKGWYNMQAFVVRYLAVRFDKIAFFRFFHFDFDVISLCIWI